MGAGSSAVWVFGRDVVVTAGRVSSLVSTVMWIVLGASGMAAVLTGDLVARVGLARAWITGMLLLAAATATIGLVPGSFLAIFSGAAVFGAVYIALTGVLLVWGTRLPRPAGLRRRSALPARRSRAGCRRAVVGLLSDATTPAAAFCAASLVAVLGAFSRPRGDGLPSTCGLRGFPTD